MPVLSRPFAVLPPEQLAGTSTAGEAFSAALREAQVTGPTEATTINNQLRFAEDYSPVEKLSQAMDLAPITERVLFGSDSSRKLSRRLTPDEATAAVRDAGMEGHVPLAKYPDGLRQDTLNLLLTLNRDRLRRQTLSQEYDGYTPGIAGMVVGSLLDPGNVALSFVPVVGEARYAQLLARAGSGWGRASTRVGIGALEGGVGAAAAEPFIYAGQQRWRDDYDATDSMLNIAGGVAFGSLLHAGAGLVKDSFGMPIPAPIEPAARQPFANPDVYAADAFRARAREAGVKEAAIEALTPSAARDDVTGYFDGRQAGVKTSTVRRAMVHSEATGEPAYYVAADIANLGGLNAHVGNVAEAANVHFRAMADILQEELSRTGGDVVALRTGGDELGLVVVNADARSVSDAMLAAEARSMEYARANGLADIPNPKRSDELGVGLHTGVSEVVPGLTMDDILRHADEGIDASKRGVDRVRSNAVAEDGVGSDPGRGAGRLPGEAPGGVRGQSERPTRSASDAGAVIDARIAELERRAKPPEGPGLAELSNEAEELAALLREQRRTALPADPRARLTADELSLVATRQAEIYRAQEALRTAQGYANRLTKLQTRLGKIDRDADLIALANELSPPVVDPFAAVRPYIAQLDPEVSAAGLRAALAQMADGRPIDVTPVLLADGDYAAATQRAMANADTLQGADPQAAVAADERLAQPESEDLVQAREYTQAARDRLSSRDEPLEWDGADELKLQRDAVKAATLCMMRTA